MCESSFRGWSPNRLIDQIDQGLLNLLVTKITNYINVFTGKQTHRG